jgi:magnesium transporter
VGCKGQELEWPWGYPLILVVMVFIGILMLVYFKRKKWLYGQKEQK